MALISSEKALELVARLSPAELRASVSNAFFAGRFLPTGLRGDDQPEDLYLALLATSQRAAIVEGCIDVFSVLAPALYATTPTLDERQNEALFRLMSLISIAHPIELQGQTQSVLQLLLKNHLPKKIRNPVVRAGLAYARTENEARFWEPLVGETLIPGYAFKALLQINPHAARIKTHLVNLWKRRLRRELTIEVAPLTADASEARGDDQKFIADVIAEVSRSVPNVNDALQAELQRYPWSAPWMAYIQDQTVRVKKQMHAKRAVSYQKIGNVKLFRSNVEIRKAQQALRDLTVRFLRGEIDEQPKVIAVTGNRAVSKREIADKTIAKDVYHIRYNLAGHATRLGAIGQSDSTVNSVYRNYRDFAKVRKGTRSNIFHARPPAALFDFSI